VKKDHVLMLQVRWPKLQIHRREENEIKSQNHEKSTLRTGRDPDCLPRSDIRVLPRKESTNRLGSPRRWDCAYRAFRMAATTSNVVMNGDDVVGVTTMSLAFRSCGRTNTNEEVNWSTAGLSRDLSLITLLSAEASYCPCMSEASMRKRELEGSDDRGELGVGGNRLGVPGRVGEGVG